jgi:4-amino-4-deoxy-L-arabinose transferase-like glycosyltransferase
VPINDELSEKERAGLQIFHEAKSLDTEGASFSEKLIAILANQTTQWAILLIASCMVLFANAQAELTGGDAVLYAKEAHLIAQTGEYATLRFGQELNHHGPLLFWLTAWAIKVFGFTPLAVTLFSRLFGIGCIVLTGVLGSHLFGKNTGWWAALALATCYTFVRNTATLRMDSGLTFGVLVAMLGYFRAEKPWGAPLFFAGIALAVLAKSVPGFLPLFLAPLHAIFAGRFHLSWKKPARSWLYWSPLVLLPLVWWGYLVSQYGGFVFSAYREDFLSIDAGQSPDLADHVYRFFATYFYDFGRKYLPWSIFTLIGLITVSRTALSSNKQRWERADAGLLVAWIIAVLIAGGLKPSQYQRYLIPALPAIAIVTAVVVVAMLRDRMPILIPAVVAVLTIVSGAGIITEPLLSRTISGLAFSIVCICRFKSDIWGHSSVTAGTI